MIQIREVRADEAQAAKEVMFALCEEIWGDSPDELLKIDPLEDYQGLPESYRARNGIFLVVLDDDQVIGSGAIRQYQEGIAEIKRVWLLKPYRGQGIGRAVMQQLVDFAYQRGYERIWLEVGTPGIQPEAMGLYVRFGFHPIPVYCHLDCELGMEKILER